MKKGYFPIKKVVVVGCSSLIVSAAELLNPLEMKVVGLGDTRPEAWNVFKENGDLKDAFDELPVMPVDLSVGFEPDVIVIAVLAVVCVAVLLAVRHRAGHAVPPLTGASGLDFNSGRSPIRPAESLDVSGQAGLRRRTAIFSALAGTAFGVLLLRLWGMQVIS